LPTFFSVLDLVSLDTQQPPLLLGSFLVFLSPSRLAQLFLVSSALCRRHVEKPTTTAAAGLADPGVGATE